MACYTGDMILARSAFLVFCLFVLLASCQQAPASCPPTPEDEMGPFYRPGAPLRDSIGEGYQLEGTVRSSRDCQAIPAALIEFWLAGPDGRYGDAWRATVRSGRDGGYRFSSIAPGLYPGRVPHIHIRVSAPGFEPLVTQHYPAAGASQADFDLVLVPEKK